MKPYFSREGVDLYCGDALEILPRLKAECAQMLLCDPPYGINYKSTSKRLEMKTIAGDHSQEVGVAALRLCGRLLRCSSHAYNFGRFDILLPHFTQPVELIWDKGRLAGGSLECPWGTAHEYIQFRMYHRSTSQIEGSFGNLSARIRKGSVLRYSGRFDGGEIRHPTEKPVPLLRELIESSSRFGDTVLDPFAGVGSTGVAALLEGRKSILIELEEKYVEIAANRLSQAVLPLDLDLTSTPAAAR